MKKFTVILGLVLSLTVIAACANKSIVGTWEQRDLDIQFVFTADGKLTISPLDGSPEHINRNRMEATYSVTDTQLTMTTGGISQIWNFSISPDGNTLTFVDGPNAGLVLTRQ